MIFTAYFDEADAHGPAPTLIMSAYLGHTYQWRRFEKKLARLQMEFGFKIFHGKEFKARSGEFSGWSDEKCASLIKEIVNLVRYNLTRGLTVHLEHDRYMNEYRAPPFPPKVHVDSQYGICFRACLGSIFEVLDARGNRDRLNVVIEHGHKNVGDCQRIWAEMKSAFRLVDLDIIENFNVSSKEKCYPLMAADMLAYGHSQMRKAIKEGRLTRDQMLVDPATTKGALAYLELRGDALAKLKTDRAEYGLLLQEHYKQAGRARKAASLSVSRSRA